MTTILIAEDHALVREGLKLLLSLEPEWTVVAETGNGLEVEQLVREVRPDLVLLDLDLPNCHGMKVAQAIKAQHSAIKIIILTGSAQAESVHLALAAGVDGYVLKKEDSDELLQTIQAVLAGKQYLSSGIAKLVENDDQELALFDRTTPRENEIIRMIAAGMNSKEISCQLHRSVLTVRKHRQNLMLKLGLHNTADIAAYAIKHGLYHQP